MINHPLYLVPFDFSRICESALETALMLARKNNGFVFLLHIVKHKSEKIKINKQFKDVLKEIAESDRGLITTNVVVGNLYEDIGKASELLNSSLVVLGTHGAKGMQKIFGSHVEKMISHSASPLLITQSEKPTEKIETIVMPFNFSRDSLQITQAAANMAKKFDACIHLVGQHKNYELEKNKIITNQNIVKQYMIDRSICIKIIDLPDKKSFGKEMMDYAGVAKADIIAAAYSNDHFIQTTNLFMQHIFDNEHHIPVLTVNSEDLYLAAYA